MAECRRDANFTRLSASDKDGLIEALEGGGLLRKPTLLNSAQQSTSFTPLPYIVAALEGVFPSPFVPSPPENTGRQGGFSKSFIAAKNNGATHISFPVFCKYPKEREGEVSAKRLENI